MTATIIENGLDTDIIELLDWQHLPACEAEYDDGTACDNKADFICSTSCCLHKLLICEDCYFEYLEYVKEYSGEQERCSMCGAIIVLQVSHLKIVGRVT